MERPYKVDGFGAWHVGHKDCEFVSAGDATLKGLHEGVAFCGEGVCPDCFPEGRRVEVFSMAKKMCEAGQ